MVNQAKRLRVTYYDQLDRRRERPEGNRAAPGPEPAGRHVEQPDNPAVRGHDP